MYEDSEKYEIFSSLLSKKQTKGIPMESVSSNYRNDDLLENVN